MALAYILSFTSSRTSFNPFFLTLYLRSITLCFFFFLISPRSFHSKMLICFRNSCIDCCIFIFHQGSFTVFPLLWFGLGYNFLPMKMAHALILSDLIFFRKTFTLIVQSLSKFIYTFLNPFTSHPYYAQKFQ